MQLITECEYEADKDCSMCVFHHRCEKFKLWQNTKVE